MALWFNQSKARQVKNRTIAAKPKSSTFHCVEVKCYIDAYDACDAVKEIHGKRFLSSEAPSLPLPECNQKCRCHFKHHEDRRSDERRDAFSASGIHYDGLKNRRLGGDRRHGNTSSYSAVRN